MQTSTNLKLDWATNEAAKFACENWHYSKCVPKSKQNKVGVWEDGNFIGVVMVGNSSGANVFDFLGLDQFTGAELTRVAIKNHKTPISKIVSIAIKFVKKKNPNLKALVSYADFNVGHVGVIYQAGNWKYFGRSTATYQWFYNGKWRNDMKLNEAFKGKRDALNKLPKRFLQGKYKYVYFFDKELEGKFKDSFLPYPKRVEHESNAVSFHETEGGAVPTDTLQRSIDASR